jgi:alanine racemase
MNAAGHRVWAEIDLGALRRNAVRMVARAGPGGRILAVVKADAYGHGAVPVARALEPEPHVWGFGVGDSREALELRAAGVTAPVLVLGAIIPDEVPQVVSHDITAAIHSLDRIVSLEAEAERQGRRARVHLMVDTGMGRLGALPARAAELARRCQESAWLELEGLASHPSPSRPGHPFMEVQLRRLLELAESLKAEGIVPPLVHFANTASVLGDSGTALPLVRPGISLYGIVPPDDEPLAGGLEPVLSLHTQVVYLKDVPADTPIGYNGTFVTARATRIATLPIGYADGLPYRLSNQGRCLVRGALAPLVGAISMDYTMVDVGHVPDVSVGEPVTLIGSAGGHHLRVRELASLVGTIPYEIPCGLGRRVARVYRRGGGAATGAEAGRPSTATASDGWTAADAVGEAGEA